MPSAHAASAVPARSCCCTDSVSRPSPGRTSSPALGAGRPMTAPWMRGLKPKDPVGFDLARSGRRRRRRARAARHTAGRLPRRVRRAPAWRCGSRSSGPTSSGGSCWAARSCGRRRRALRMQRLAMRLVPESKLVDAGVSRPRMLAVLDALKGFDGTESLRQVTVPVLLVVGWPRQVRHRGRAAARRAAARQRGGRHRGGGVGAQHRGAARARRPHHPLPRRRRRRQPRPRCRHRRR